MLKKKEKYVKLYVAMQGNGVGYSFFSIYTYNLVPFVNDNLLFDVTKYKNIMCNFVPITNILTPSITDTEIIQYYKCTPIIHTIYITVCIYSSVNYNWI